LPIRASFRAARPARSARGYAASLTTEPDRPVRYTEIRALPSRPLDGAPYPYLTLDALVVKCREGGRTVNVCVVHAVGVNRDGFRESLGLDVVTAEDGAAWLAFLR
jgi:transposase-like protein